jgi:hypothetical protein
MLSSGMLQQLQTNLLLSFVLNGATTDTSGKDVPNPNVGVVRRDSPVRYVWRADGG